MIDYAEEIFTREYIDGNNKLYATFHPEPRVDKDEYDITNRWLIVLLHPELGLQTFFLIKNNLMNRWELDQHESNDVEDEVLQWCGKQIEIGKRRKTI